MARITVIKSKVVRTNKGLAWGLLLHNKPKRAHIYTIYRSPIKDERTLHLMYKNVLKMAVELKRNGINLLGLKVVPISKDKAKVVIYTDKPLEEQYLTRMLSFGIIEDIVGGITGAIGELVSGVVNGVKGWFIPEIVIPDPKKGPGIGDIIVLGMLITGAYLILDQIVREEAVKKGYPAPQPVVYVPVEVAKTVTSAATQVAPYVIGASLGRRR